MEHLLSFVIPCYRSEKTVGKVIEEIREVMSEREGYDYEIVAVNDCSPDNVYGVLIEEANKDNKISVIDLAANTGKQSAVMAGLSVVHGEFVVCLDDDCQCPVHELWKLVDGVEHGYDIAMAEYGKKKESAFRNWGSRMNAAMFNLLLSKPKKLQLTNFYIIKRFVIDEMLKYKNPYPYLHGLMLRTTKNIIGIPMSEREREEGKSGYTLKKLVSFWADGLTGFSVKPLRIATVLGFLFSAAGFLYAVALVVKKVIFSSTVAGWTSLMAVQLLIGGLMLILIGLVGEYVGRIYICINSSPQYVIRNIVKNEYHEEDNKVV